MGDTLASAGLAAGGFIAGQQQQKKTKTAEKNRKKELLGIQGNLMGIANESYGEQYGYLKKAGKESEKGYKMAIDDATRIGAQSAGEVNRFFNQALGGANANAAGRGLLGSSVNANMRLGAARQASIAMSDAQIAASRLKSQAQIGLGATRAGTLQGLAGLSAYRGGMRAQALLPYMNFLSNVQYTSQQPQTGNLAGLGSMMGGWKPTGTV